MRCLCWDLDGTLADHRHRLHLVEGKVKNYDAFIQAIPQDLPNADIVWLYHHMRAHPEVKSLIVTNRPQRALALTEAWLQKQGIPHDGIYMRHDTGFGPSAVTKQKSLIKLRADGFNPIFAVDDKAPVVGMWRSEGVTCLQVAPGNY